MKQYASIRECKRCLYSSKHPLGLIIDEDGICSGCRIHEEKDSLIWEDRFAKLKKIVEPYRSTSKKTYDCIVPVSGANDSYFIVHVVKNLLKLNPLLVSYNKYFNTETGIRNLANLRIQFNADIYIQNVNPVSVKKIVRRTLSEFGSIYWHCIAGQTVFPVQTSVRMKIPLIIWGAHQGLEQVGMFSHEHEVEMTRRYRKDHDLMGYEPEDLIGVFGNLNEEDIWQYLYPSDFDLNSVGTRGIYLGNYLRWDPKAQHEEMIQRYNYKTSSFERTFDNYDYVDCFNYMNLHDLIKYYKTGFSKVTDHASREIRHGRLSRENAVTLVKSYENNSPQFIEQFCEWLEVPSHSLYFLLDQFRNNKFWEKKEYSDWETLEELRLKGPKKPNKEKYISFVSNNSGKESDEYITLGKGVDPVKN